MEPSKGPYWGFLKDLDNQKFCSVGMIPNETRLNEIVSEKRKQGRSFNCETTPITGNYYEEYIDYWTHKGFKFVEEEELLK